MREWYIILLIRTDKSIDPLNVLAVTRASPSDCQAGADQLITKQLLATPQ